jgi:MFS family permease
MGGLTGVVRWLQLLVLGVYTFETTGSPFLVSLIPIMWMLPLSLIGPMMGVFADRVNRRVLYLVGLASVATVASTAALLSFLGTLTFAHIAVASLLSGIFWTMDFPVRRRMMGDIAADSLSTAMSLDSATNNATRMAGPLLGGVLLQVFSLTGVFIFSASMYLICFVLMSFTKVPQRAAPTTSTAFFRDLGAGIRFVAADPNLRRIFLITIIFNLFGFPFTSMVPVIGRALLDLNPFMVGLLSSMEGLGAFIGAILVAIYSRPESFYRIYVMGTGAVLTLVGYLGVLTHVVGGPLHSYLAITVTLIAVGVFMACFAAMQGTLTYLGAPTELRSRILGVLTLCIGTGPLGFLNVGWMSENFGVPTALTIMSAEGLFALLLVWVFAGEHKTPETSPP